MSNSLQLAYTVRVSASRPVPLIDKLEVRIPAGAPYTSSFAKLYPELCFQTRVFSPSRHYLMVGDLRPYSFDLILHAHCKRGEAGNHKIELLDCGAMSFARMLHEITRVFDVDAMRLQARSSCRHP